MDRNWSRQELAERWSLGFEELERIEGKSEPLQLGFAAQLKFYQLAGRFPVSAAATDLDEVPPPFSRIAMRLSLTVRVEIIRGRLGLPRIGSNYSN